MVKLWLLKAKSKGCRIRGWRLEAGEGREGRGRSGGRRKEEEEATRRESKLEEGWQARRKWRKYGTDSKAQMRAIAVVAKKGIRMRIGEERN